MARGITQEQVNEAADAILGAGENPTVEKVRISLGTGSPNTITRMLDTWRGQLGERLRQLSALPEVPDAVGQAMIELWRLASEHAERMLDGRYADEHAALEAARLQLTQDRDHWETRLQTAETSVAQAQAARDLAEHACSTLDGQLQDSHALRADLVQQRDRLQDLCDQQAAQMEALRARLDEHQATLKTERERQEAHLRAVEDRSHQEIDRARQDARQWRQRHETAERTFRETISTMQVRQESDGEHARRLEQEVARQAGQVAAMERALSEAYAAAKAARQNKVASTSKGKSKSAENRTAKPRKIKASSASKPKKTVET